MADASRDRQRAGRPAGRWAARATAKRRSGSSVRTSTNLAAHAVGARDVTDHDPLGLVGRAQRREPISGRSMSTTSTRMPLAADPGDHRAQRLGRAAAAADDLAEVVGMHPHLERRPRRLRPVDRHVVGVLDDAP